MKTNSPVTFRAGAWGALFIRYAALLQLFLLFPQFTSVRAEEPVEAAAPVTTVAATACDEPCVTARVSLPRPQDEVWLIRSPLVCCCEPPLESVDGLKFWRLAGCHQWRPADLAGLLATDNPRVPTIVVIHGNRTDMAEAICMTWDVYHHAASSAGDDRPLRIIAWSWPAEKIRGRMKEDFRVKAERSDLVGFHVAWLLRRINADVPVSLVGYSYGARVISAAMHLAGGGEVAGYALGGEHPPRRGPVRAVLVAAAMDNHWLLPEGCHGLAVGQVDRLTLTVNCADRVLKRYHRLYGRGGPDALGYTGAVGLGDLGPAAGRVEQIDVSGYVGKAHRWSVYIQSPGVTAALQWDPK